MALQKRHASGKGYKQDSNRVRRAEDKTLPPREVPPYRPARKRDQRVRHKELRLMLEDACGVGWGCRHEWLRNYQRARWAMRWLHDNGHIRSGKPIPELVAMALAAVPRDSVAA